MNVDELVDELRAAAAQQPAVSGDLPAIVGRARRRQRRRLTGLGAVAAVAVAGATLVRIQDDDGARVVETADMEVGSTWELLEPYPDRVMTPKLVWTGDEVLAMGGDRFLCGIAASCVPPDDPPSRDLFRLDMASGRWEPLEPAPIGIAPGEESKTAIVDRVLYVAAYEFDGSPRFPTGRRLLRYDLGADRWSTVTLPPELADGRWSMAAAGSRLVLYLTSEEQGPTHPDYVFEPDSSAWTALPDDPHSPAFDRTMVWAEDHLYLFDHDLAGGRSDGFPELRVARLGLGDDEWEDLLSIPQGGGGPTWLYDQGRLVNPSCCGIGDGRPPGGILDLDTLDWSPLPAPPENTRGIGVVGSEGSLMIDDPYPIQSYERILDLRTGTWRSVPELPGAQGSFITVGAGPSIVAIAGGYGPSFRDEPPQPDTHVWDLEVTGDDEDSAPADMSGSPAVWSVDPGNLPDPTSTSFTALVRRMECSGGVTGEVLAPVIDAGTDEIVVTFSVEPLPAGNYLCPGNLPVETVVDLGVPVGGRRLVDGACSTPPAVRTTYCQPNGTRWPDETPGFHEDRARSNP